MSQGFQIGSLTIRYYALIIILGALLGSWLSSTLAKKNGRDPEVIIDILPWALLGGIIGARLWHVLSPSASNVAMGLSTEYYFKHPVEILMIWKGGLGIFGAVLGGAIALYIYCRVTKLNFLEWADYIAPGLLIGQAIGRWGNFVNQEVYGLPSNLPWAITIDPPYRLPGFEAVATYHPLFLYESLLCLLSAGLIIWLGNKWKDKLYKGDAIILYGILYPFGRFLLEYLRLDPSPVKGININQTVMLIVAIACTALLVLRHTVWPPKPEVAEEVATEDEKCSCEECNCAEESESCDCCDCDEDLDSDEELTEADEEALDEELRAVETTEVASNEDNPA